MVREERTGQGKGDASLPAVGACGAVSKAAYSADGQGADLSLQAARWLVALEDAEDDPTLQAEFQRWLALDPRHAQVWDETCCLYGALANVERRAPVAAQQKLPSVASIVILVAFGRRARPIALGIVGMAAAALFVLGVGTILGPWWQDWDADHRTAVAETQDLRLEDQTQVQLAARSALDVAYSDERREVTLRRGRGFFHVTRDSRRPFTVHANGAEITVLGTAFEVENLGDEVRVAVEHGAVSVSCTGGEQSLSPPLLPGQWISVVCDPRQESVQGGGSVNVAQIAPWRSGQVIARNDPVSLIIDRLRPYYKGVIILQDQSVGARRVSGVYRTEDVPSAVHALAAAHGVRVEVMTPWVMILRAQEGGPSSQ